MTEYNKEELRELSPESGWKVESKKHFLEITHIDQEGKELTTVQERIYTPYSSDVNVMLLKGDKEVKVRPFDTEVFTKVVEIQRKGKTVTKITISINTNDQVNYITTHTVDELGRESYSQYFFRRDGAPGGVNHADTLQTPTWEVERPQVVNHEILDEIGKLARELPETTSKSLYKACMALTIDSDG